MSGSAVVVVVLKEKIMSALLQKSIGVPVGIYVSSFLTRQPYKDVLNIEPVGDAVSIVTELRIIQSRGAELGGTNEQRIFLKKKLCDLLFSKILPDLLIDDELLPYQVRDSREYFNDSFIKFWASTNRCLECYEDLGPQNSRQLCGKTFCLNVPL